MRTLLSKIKNIRSPVRSLLYLFWINMFVFDIISAFSQIAIFKAFSSMQINILGAMISYSGIMIGFCLFGYILSRKGLNAKQGFYFSFFFCILGILTLSKIESVQTAYIALFLNGLGNGLFWLTLHTYELVETKDEERDFYSSVLTSGRNIIAIVSPLFATALVWISIYILHLPSLTLLFLVMPLAYILGLFCFKGVSDYIPKPIDMLDIKHFLTEKRNRLAQIYIGSTGSTHILATTFIPIAIFYILGTELRFGIYSTLVGILTVVLVLALGQHRHKGNRVFLFGISTFGITLILLFLGYKLTFLALVIFTLVNTILTPIMQVSDHVIALQTMESIGRNGKDFYATMILRDFSLWFWRMFTGAITLIISIYIHNHALLISTGLYLLGAGVLLSFFGAHFLVKRMNLVV